MPINWNVTLLAIGCPDVSAPANGWARRDGDDLSIACHTEDGVWRFECVDRHWQGPTDPERNCTAGE